MPMPIHVKRLRKVKFYSTEALLKKSFDEQCIPGESIKDRATEYFRMEYRDGVFEWHVKRNDEESFVKKSWDIVRSRSYRMKTGNYPPIRVYDGEITDGFIRCIAAYMAGVSEVAARQDVQ